MENFSCSPNLDRSGQQCCYGTDGVLIRQPVGGSADRISPVRSYYEHIIQDLLPFIHCCRETDSVICQNYFQQRPAGSSQGYVLIPPGSNTSKKLANAPLCYAKGFCCFSCEHIILVGICTSEFKKMKSLFSREMYSFIVNI